MNQFDFHVVEIISSRKTDIYNAVDNKDEAKAKIQTKVIRDGRFPRKEYRLVVGYVDAISDNASEKVDALLNQYKDKGVRVHSRYICRDWMLKGVKKLHNRNMIRIFESQSKNKWGAI